MGSEMCIRDRGYRSQFIKLVKDKGYAGLIEKMKEKIAKGE